MGAKFSPKPIKASRKTTKTGGRTPNEEFSTMANTATRRLLAALIAIVAMVGMNPNNLFAAAPAARTSPTHIGECLTEANLTDGLACCRVAPRGWRRQCQVVVKSSFGYEARAIRAGFTAKGSDVCYGETDEAVAVSCCYALRGGRRADCLETVLGRVDAGKITAAPAADFPPSERERTLEELASRRVMLGMARVIEQTGSDLGTRMAELKALADQLPATVGAEVERQLKATLDVRDAERAKAEGEFRAALEIRLQTIEKDIQALKDRMAALEERVGKLERRAYLGGIVAALLSVDQTGIAGYGYAGLVVRFGDIYGDQIVWSFEPAGMIGGSPDGDLQGGFMARGGVRFPFGLEILAGGGGHFSQTDAEPERPLVKRVVGVAIGLRYWFLANLGIVADVIVGEQVVVRGDEESEGPGAVGAFGVGGTF